MAYLPPLHVYVVFHPESLKARKLADQLALWLTGDPDSYAVPEADIPTFTWTGREGRVPEPIPFGRAARTAVLLLVDDDFMASEEWRGWARTTAEMSDEQGKVYLVALTRNAFNIGGPIRNDNALRLYEFDETQFAPELRVRATHVLVRLLLNKSSIFISHAKAGGLELANALRAYLFTRPLGTVFFDEVSIEDGEDFENKLHEGLDTSVVVVLLTDRYAGRYWCGWEVLTAKTQRRPMLVVDALEKGEPASLKYAGNTRTIRWRPDAVTDSSVHQEVVSGALLELLRHQHNLVRIDAIRTGATLPADALLFGTAPELASLPGRTNKKEMLVLHPDPPLSAFEAELINRHRPDVKTMSLTQAIAGIRAPLLGGKRVAISISNGPDRALFGTSETDQERLWARLATILLAAGAELAYGGDLRSGGYTERLWDLVRAATPTGQRLPRNVVHSYLGWPIHVSLQKTIRAAFPDVVQVRELPMPAALGRDPAATVPSNDLVPANHFAWAASMAYMRSTMANECHARILIGGQFRSVSPVPGLVDELLSFVDQKKPVYLVGTFGGMARVLARAILGERPQELTRAFQEEDGKRTNVLAYYEAQTAKEPWKHLPSLDFEATLSRLAALGAGGLENGLSEDENRILFESKDLLQITALLMKGLRLTLGSETPCGGKNG
jgi:hypothetical protein